ncbi:peptidyl-prolyl cis-trans isomerase cyclophilin type [Oscillatoria nigro-viridis PCC 7112]|uniref:peptidylprolyl isomerase n=1 Tax=Phormidium nigroviride PCC 7112 TaxID=179408 RepID=K9VNF3_9CYAN|nr:peptidylprolyl isomerase [Oscillatoria nigro-viridis]AFZ09618.1 peptidyl-prolyl cis-trans isomerase cyclophilin type [Oscillatoria nigro-viridis PCC 7112]
MSAALPLPGKAIVVQVINGQPVTIEVDGTNAPITGGNFVDLVERGIYDGVMFHRVVRQPDPFVVQGGDPRSRDTTIPASQLGTGSFIDPDTNQARFIPLEIKPQGAAQPVYNQVVTQTPQLQHTRGAVAMARSNALNSASSQFYFALDDLPFLDGNYAVFGNVIQGFETVNAVQQGDRISTAKVVGGIVPSRVSSIITDVNVLNDFINSTNFVNLSLRSLRLSNTPNNYQATSQDSQQNPSGVVGGSANDRILGSPTDDAINGSQGNDTITGEAGDDFLRGGKGNDLISGGVGNDIINGNLGDDTVNGDAGNDFLRGGRGNDVLIGGDGNDILVGDIGSDTLTGGAGADTFVLTTGENLALDTASDIILDFRPGDGDRIGLTSGLSNTSFTQSGSDTLIQFGGVTLAVVQNSVPAAVQNAAFAINFSTISRPDDLPVGDAALRIG